MLTSVNMVEKDELSKEIRMRSSSLFSDGVIFESALEQNDIRELDENNTKSYLNGGTVQNKKILFDEFYLLKLIGKGKIYVSKFIYSTIFYIYSFLFLFRNNILQLAYCL